MLPQYVQQGTSPGQEGEEQEPKDKGSAAHIEYVQGPLQN